jgi:hypothetical protein
MMRNLLVFSALALTAFPAAASAQAVSGARDGTNNVISDRIGMAGNTSDALSQYQQQRALNNLPTGESARTLGPARPAASGELTAGATVNDNSGVAIATVDEVDPDGVVVSTAAGKVKIPADAFGHNKAGLLLDMTKRDFDNIVAQANAAS